MPPTATSETTGDIRTLELDLAGMTCASCVRRVDRALRTVAGVAETDVNLVTQRATVRVASGASNGGAHAADTLRDLAAAVEADGYEVLGAHEASALHAAVAVDAPPIQRGAVVREPSSPSEAPPATDLAAERVAARDAAHSGARSPRGPRTKSATAELSRARRILLGAAPVVGHGRTRVRMPDEARDDERVEPGAARRSRSGAGTRAWAAP